MQLEAEKKKLLKEASDNDDKVAQAQQKYYQLKEEVDKSPMTILRNELGQK
jgi:hypothetical protein